MSELHRPLSDDLCPIPDQMLGEMYRSSPNGLSTLIATVSPELLARLAIYCYRRAHLAGIGLAIAGSCEKDDLTAAGGNAGAILFHQSRKMSPPRPSLAEVSTSKRKVSLSTGPLRNVTPLDQELE